MEAHFQQHFRQKEKKQSTQNFLQATKNQGVDGINELQTEQIRKGKTVKSIPTEALKNARK